MAKKEINKNEKKQEEKKDKNTKEQLLTKRNIGIALIILVAIILIVIAVIISSNSSEEEPAEEELEEIYSTEETVEEEYGFSKDDAINSVKEMFNSDNYSFDATLRNDNMYIVTVTNTETNDVYTFIVDPNDGSYSMELDEDE